MLKALGVLAHIARAPGPVTLADLSATAGLPKPTAHRLARLLEQAQLVQKDPLTRRYAVGARLVELGFEALRNAPAHRNRRLLLERLSEKLGETVNLAVLAGDQIVYLDRVEASWPLRIHFKPGSRLPVYCTANGKLLLAYAPPAVRERILRSLRLQRHAPNTITCRLELRRALEEIRRQGYAEDNEEYLAGVCCVAVPVRDRRGRVVAGLAVAGPLVRFDLARARSLVGDLQSTADLIGLELSAEADGTGG